MRGAISAYRACAQAKQSDVAYGVVSERKLERTDEGS